MDQQAIFSLAPYRYLARDDRAELLSQAAPRRLFPGERLWDQGDSGSFVFVLLEGSLDTELCEGGVCRHRGVVHPGSSLGERSVVYDEARSARVSAATASEGLLIRAETLLALVERSSAFAQALARKLRHKRAVFLALEGFISALGDEVRRGQVDFERLLSLYRELSPAIHRGVDGPELDLEAWGYAVLRLPDNITAVHVLLLAPALPDSLRHIDLIAEPVESLARRRAAWALSPGKDLVVMRDARTDLIDFMTNLCLHATESRKLRRRLRSAELLRDMSAAVDSADPSCAEELLERLPLSAAELAGLRRIWPRELMRRLWELALHHEDYSVYIDAALKQDHSDGADRWAEALRRAAVELIGDDPAIEVDIISSNTHSVVNCLSPYLQRERAVIESWAQGARPGLWEASFYHPADRFYVLARAYFEAHPEASVEREAFEREHGIVTLDELGLTGIAVNLIDTSRIDRGLVDPLLRRSGAALKRRLIVNIDYAFGCQAEEILSSLLLLFGARVRSVNVLGKAGGLGGQRGAILAPTLLILQRDDGLYTVENPGVDLARACAGAPLEVRRGPVLTVAGTLLQNALLLKHYRRLWRCVGLEMEGSHYARQVRRCRLLGLVRSDLAERYLYYVSDLPLEEGVTLSKPLAPTEGTPALYATTRAMLDAILN